jgi:hypothetical protein
MKTIDSRKVVVVAAMLAVTLAAGCFRRWIRLFQLSLWLQWRAGVFLEPPEFQFVQCRLPEWNPSGRRA